MFVTRTQPEILEAYATPRNPLNETQELFGLIIASFLWKQFKMMLKNYVNLPDDEFIGHIHDDLRTGVRMNSQCFSKQKFLEKIYEIRLNYQQLWFYPNN